MNLKEKMALTAKFNGLTRQSNDQSLSLFDRMKISRERMDVLRQLKVSVKGEDKQEREQIGDNLPNVTIERNGANDITITRQTRYEPVVYTVKIDRKKAKIDVIPQLGEAKSFTYSGRDESFTGAVQEANNHLLKGLDTWERVINEQGDEQAAETEAKANDHADLKAKELNEFQAQRDRIKAALEAFEGIKARDEQDKLPTPAQREAMREAILDMPTAKAYLDDDGALWRVGESILPKRLASVNEVIAEIESELSANTLEPELIKQYKAGELVTLTAPQFKDAMADVHDLGLDLDDIKRGAVGWFEFNQKEAA